MEPASLPALDILIAEDNQINQIVAVRLVAMLGYSADLATNGNEVMRMLETKHYDMVLMDCQMPEMDGFEATKRILATYPPEKRPAIYALTASVMDQERTRCLNAGMRAVLRKPITLDALRSAFLDCPVRKG